MLQERILRQRQVIQLEKTEDIGQQESALDMRNHPATPATETHNFRGCPYLLQTGPDAVVDWARVLADIDLTALSPDLQAELRQLQQGNERRA